MMENPGARELLLRLLLVADDGVLSSAEAVRGCSLFGITENTARVALTRLVAAGLVEPVERGAYRLGQQGRTLRADIAAWREAGQRLRPWSGAWVAVSTAGLGRTDRAALRVRDRALALVGLRMLDPGFHVRPDNFAGGVAATRERLHVLGLPREAAVFRADEFDAQRDARARLLWNVDALDAGYQASRQKLERSLARLDKLPLEAAARECYLLGDEAVRLMVFDPMLPEPLVDVARRESFSDLARRYDANGRGIWRRFLKG